VEVLAYLDPGSGSMVLQLLLGGVAGILISIKMFGRRVFRALTFWKRDDGDEREEKAAAAEPEADAVKEIG
jgi:hypothetical protein